MARRARALAPCLLLVVFLAAAACSDPSAPERGPTGEWIAVAIDDAPLPRSLRCDLNGCTHLEDMQLRFRTRGRLLDLRRFYYEARSGARDESVDVGDAYPYQLLGGGRFAITRPVADTAYADTGSFTADTILLNVRKLEPQFGGLGNGRGPLVTYVRFTLP